MTADSRQWLAETTEADDHRVMPDCFKHGRGLLASSRWEFELQEQCPSGGWQRQRAHQIQQGPNARGGFAALCCWCCHSPAVPLPSVCLLLRLLTLLRIDARTRSRWYGPDRPQLPAALGGQQPHLTGAVAGGLVATSACTASLTATDMTCTWYRSE